MPGGNREFQDLERRIETELFRKVEKQIHTTTAPLVARVKHLEDTQTDSVKIKALEQEVAKQSALLKTAQDHDKRQVGYQRAVTEKVVQELTHARLAQMDAKLAKTELLEARLKGMETMIRAMEQTIDMLQRNRR